MKKSAIFFLTLASFSFGSFVVLLKYLLNLGYSSFSLVASTAIFLLIFGVFYSFVRRDEIKKISRKNWLRIFLLGFLATFLGRILMFVGQSLTSAINAGFLMKLTAVTTLPFAYFLLGEKVERKDFFAFLIMLVGTFFLVTGGKLTMPRIGDLILILLVTMIGFTNSLARLVMKDVNPYVISSLRLSIGSFLHLAIFLCLFDLPILTPLLTIPTFIFIAGLLGFTYIFTFYKGIELAGASIATIFFLLSAVFTAVFAYLFLHEAIGVIAGIGAVLILIGAFFLAK